MTTAFLLLLLLVLTEALPQNGQNVSINACESNSVKILDSIRSTQLKRSEAAKGVASRLDTCVESVAKIARWDHQGLQRSVEQGRNTLGQLNQAVLKGDATRQKTNQHLNRHKTALQDLKKMVESEVAAFRSQMQGLSSTLQKIADDLKLTNETIVANLVRRPDQASGPSRARGAHGWSTDIKPAPSSAWTTFEMPSASLCAIFKPKLAKLALRTLPTGTYVYRTEVALAHEDAADWCEARGMRLARFETQIEMQLVAANATVAKTTLWVGASDVGHARGDFRWNDGAELAESFWSPGQPKSHVIGKETCVSIYNGSGQHKLSNYDCLSKLKFVCELLPQFAAC